MFRDPKEKAVEKPVKVFNGLAASQGCAAGPAYVFRSAAAIQVPDYEISPEQADAEWERLEEAVAKTRVQIEAMALELEKRVNNDGGSSIFQGHLMMLSDPEMLEAYSQHIRDLHENASLAVWRSTEKYCRIFEAMDDLYLRERVADIRDIARRIIRNLRGNDDAGDRMDRPGILVADELTPAETIGLPRKMILGIATDKGSLTSHATLLARALGIPAVVGLKGLTAEVNTGDELLLNGTTGVVIANPGGEELTRFGKAVQDEMTARCAAIAPEQPACSLDGRRVALLANVDPNTDWKQLLESGAEGIGLYRTEYMWMSVGRHPSEEEQFAYYMDAVSALPKDFGITVRLFDLGGDKMVEEDSLRREANPFLGNRSIRFLLRNPEVLRGQLRAILRASAFGKIKILYPMVATLEELKATNIELLRCMKELKAAGIAYDADIRRGVMIEVPSAALIADALAKEVDFFSIGTNDLIQYTLAVDRSNEVVSRLYQPTHPGVLALIKNAIDAARRNNIEISVCGEAASNPVYAALLLGLGIDSLSMSPGLLAAVKSMVCTHSFADLKQLGEEVLQMNTETSAKIYAHCGMFLRRTENV